MPGPVSSVRANVNHIRNLLEQYKCEADGFTIWKELIQNANDAEAAALQIGWCRGLKSASHPLLKEPALFVVNSGEFKPDDAEKLLTIGDTSKSADTAKIGRFGLGMKSLFHWCEAFIFIASDAASDVQWESRNNVFSPWFCPPGSKETSRHADWDRFVKADKSFIESELREVISDLHTAESEKHWFCVWIPLRNESQLNGRSPIPREAQFNFNCEEDVRRLFAPELSIRIGETLPLLDRLERVCLWQPTPGGGRLQKTYEIKFAGNTPRPSLRDKKSFANGSTTSSGLVSSNVAPAFSARFVRRDCLLPQIELVALQKQKGWPRVPGGTDEFDHDAPEKAEPHAAVRVIEVPLREGHRAELVLQWAVFLPLSEKVEQPLILGAWKRSISVLLHGYFFTDSGRRLVEPGTHNGPIAAWNQTLQNNATLPLLLPTLDQFVKEVGASDAEVSDLVRALEQSEFIKSRLSAICKDWQWLQSVECEANGDVWTTSCSWRLVPLKSEWLSLPRPKKGVNPFELLPSLRKSQKTVVWTFKGAARITARPNTDWAPSALRAVVTSLVAKVVFKSDANLEYLASFLEHCAASKDQETADHKKTAIGEALWPILKKAFQDDSLTLQRIEELGDTLRRVLEFVPEENRLVLSWAKSDPLGADAIFRMIAKDFAEHDECKLVLIPQSVKPDGRDGELVDLKAVKRLLEGLAKLPVDRETLGNVLGKLLDGVDRERRNLSLVLEDLELVSIHNCQTGGDGRFSWKKYYDQSRSRLVFVEKPDDWTNPLQNALGKSGDVWRISTQFAEKLLGKKHGLPSCYASECADAFTPSVDGVLSNFTGSKLGEWESRRELLTKLADNLEVGSKDARAKTEGACRLLIHGRITNAIFNETNANGEQVHGRLFLSIEGQIDELAETLVRHVLKKRIDTLTKQNEEWRVLTGESAVWSTTRLSVDWQQKLALVPLKLAEPAVLDFLSKAKPDHLMGLELSEDDYGRLLTELAPSCDDLLKRLPIHTVANSNRKQRVSIPDDSGKVFWDVGYKLAPELTRDITLLALDQKRPKVAERQNKLFAHRLDPVVAISLVMKREQPHEHWQTILRAIEKSDNPLPDNVLADLKSKAWLPSRFGAKGCKDLICLTLTPQSEPSKLPEEFKQEVTRLVNANNGAWIADWMLDAKLLKELTRESRTVCKRLFEWGMFPNETESLQQLGCLLGEDKQHHIGHVPFDLFQDWLAIEWDVSVMPAHQVLKAVANVVGPDICFEHASADVRKPIEDHDRWITILNWLALFHENRLPNQDLVLRCFGTYFGNFIRSNEGRIPTGLEKLLCQSGKWQSPKHLCLPTEGIADHCQLHRDLAKFLCQPSSDLVSEDFDDQLIEPGINENSTLTDDIASSALTVRDYFCPWEIRVQLPVIGGFLAVLGADPLLRKYTERVLGKYRIEGIQGKLVRQVDGALTDRVLSPDRTDFSIRVVSAKTEKVRNILGGYFDADLDTKGDDLLLGFGDGTLVRIERAGTRRVCEIRLRRINIDTKSQEDLNRILCDATQNVLVEAFKVPLELAKSQSENVFNELAQSDQLEITTTQQMILSGAFVAWEQLGLSSDPAFGPLLAKLQGCLRSQPQNRTPTKRGTDSTRGLDDAYRDLKDLIETDAGAQERCLAAVRHQVGDNNQYNHESVLFELSQNADDALLEAKKEEPFRLFLDVDRIAIRHFGRKINQVPHESTTRDDRRADDLWKMLTLWLTNKNTHDAAPPQIKLTGKFGLGFKSVFLVSNQPRLLSGQLSCVIVGGVFPRYLNSTERECFDRYLTDLTTPEQKLAVTVIELPLTPRDVDHNTGGHVDELALKPLPIAAASIVGRFRELAHLLVVFSQRIRRIEIVDEATGKTHKTEWQDLPVPGVTGCFKGTLQPLPELLVDPTSAKPRSNNDVLALRVLVLRTSQHGGALLLVHDGLQFQKLPQEVPTLWVTAPTLETLDVGFALNARFSLDPGRAQLGRVSPENNKIAAELGRELGQRLVALFEHSRRVGWSQFCQDIGLDSDASEYKFWDSLWELLGPGLSRLSEKSSAAKLLLQVFWQTDLSAARQLYSSCRALPNGLDCKFARLTAIRDVQYELNGLLAEFQVLERVATWNAWRRKEMAPAVCLARARIVIPLEKLGRLIEHSSKVVNPEDVLTSEIDSESSILRETTRPLGRLDWLSVYRAKIVKLDHLLTNEVESASAMSSKTAARLSAVLFNDPCVSKEFDGTGEWKQIIPILEAVALPDRTGNPQPAKQLLFGALPQNMNDATLADEVKLAGFAPSDRVLCRQFLIGVTARSVVRLIRKCRGHHELKAQEIAGWALKAKGANQQNAVIHYLAAGSRCVELKVALRSREAEVRASWLAGLVGSKELQTMSEQVAEITQQIHQYETTHARQVQSGDILRRMLEWWRSPDRPALEPRRYGLFDPKAHGLLQVDYDRRDVEQRKAWMRLFLLGISHTMGRTTSSQSAGFLERCEQHGWLDVFIEPDGNVERWSTLLQDYLDEQIDRSEYLHWMRQFVGIFAMAENLDEYVESFLSIDRKEKPFTLKSITCPRSSHESPADAPPVHRILGMGANFIVRELLRLKVLTKHLAWEHAFVPKGEVRGMLQSLGCSFLSRPEGSWMWSQEIWRFLREHLDSESDAIFERGFDLPFQVLAHKDNTSKRLEILEVDLGYDQSESVTGSNW